MFMRILKKDMSKRKGINVILFVFITLATVFLASSVNNILVVNSGVNYYLEYANVPDINFIVNSTEEKQEIDMWLESQKKNGRITDYDYNQFIALPDKDVKAKTGNKIKSLDFNSLSLYASKMDVDFNKVYDEKGKEFTLKQGEIALATTLMNRNHLNIGDKILIHIQNQEYSFVIKEKIKDAAFGSEMVGMIRFIISEEDYQTLSNHSKLGIYYITTNHVEEVSQKTNDQAYRTMINIVTKDTYHMVYSFDMIMSALLILIGICLIFIALLVLRFTLVFTMEEQYQEIGILKAIGFKNRSIKKIYLLKYFAIVSIGSLLGLVLSIPISNAMITSVSKNMIMETVQANFGVNILCALVIIILVLLFCYFCTRKLNRVSAITAIRNGETGERFEKQKGIKLSKRAYMPVSFYLGFNDIMRHLRRYAVLMITFAISFVLITIPLNTLNTMTSHEMLYKFMLNPDSSIHLRSIEAKGDLKYTNITDVTNGMKRIKKELVQKGYQNVKMTAAPLYFINYSSLDKKQKQNLMTIQLIGDEVDYAQYDTGAAPVLENEIAFSKDIMEKNDWHIGDSVNAVINGKNENMIITGTYTDYMQLGQSARLNSNMKLDEEVIFDYWNIMIHMDTQKTPEALKETLRKELPNYEWMTGQDLVNQNVGGIQDMLREMVFPMTMMLCAIIMLITLLMEKLFIVRERGETAMLKSIGFQYHSIRSWQIIRMILVALTSMVVAIPLSLFSNQFVLKPIFALMGADVTIQVDPWNVYFIYPGILLLGIIVATIIATRDVKKIDIRACNHLE